MLKLNRKKPKKEQYNLETERSEIQRLGLGAIKSFFKIDPATDLNKETLTLLHNKAKLGMQFERELNLNRRSIELNYIRVFKMISEDKEELKKLIRKSIPQYIGK